MLLSSNQEHPAASCHFELNYDLGTAFCLQGSRPVSRGLSEDSRAFWGGGHAPVRPTLAMIEANNNNRTEGRESTQRAAEQPQPQYAMLQIHYTPKTQRLSKRMKKDLKNNGEASHCEKS